MLSIPDYAGWISGIIPMGGLIYFSSFNRGENWRVSKPICGVLLILLGAYMAGLYVGLLALVDSYLQEKTALAWLNQIKHASTVWLVVFPAASIGIGVNLVSAWLTTKPPKS